MPVYDYGCAACGQLTEVIHGIYDAGPRFCPACGVEGTLRKRLVAPAVHFKGSGWAKKDRSTAKTTSKSTTDASDGAGASTEATATSSSDAAPGSTGSTGDAAAPGKAASSPEPKARAAGAAHAED